MAKIAYRTCEIAQQIRGGEDRLYVKDSLVMKNLLSLTLAISILDTTTTRKHLSEEDDVVAGIIV